MNDFVPDKKNALELLKKYNKSESLIRHGLTVAAIMKHFAMLFNEDNPEMWEVVGLLHDIDYEMYPDEHCKKAKEILEKENYPEKYIHAIQSHGYGICCDVKPELKMEKVLYTVDELSGLINAAAIVRPSKSILDMTVKSVKKKWKQKSFAAGVNRDVILKGAEMLGMDLNEIIQETINGMKEDAEEIGLKGNL